MQAAGLQKPPNAALYQLKSIQYALSAAGMMLLMNRFEALSSNVGIDLSSRDISMPQE
jgi:hypothetical protein